MLLLVIILKGLVEVLVLSLLAQGVLYLFAGAARERNVVYRIFSIVNRPVLRATRIVTPRFIVDAHVGFVSLFLLAVFWVFLLAAKVHYYLAAGAPPV